MNSTINVIFETFKQENFECFLVGGCVRDLILGIEPHDYDFATNALPDDVELLFEHTIPTGKKYGTITVILNDEAYEITTYRKDLDYSDNRRPTAVNFSNSINEDLARRDFTMNAIAYNPEKGYVDIYNGRKDINDKIIKCVGTAEERFTEDSLRIIRGLRFALKYDFTIEYNTQNAMLKNMHLLDNLSKERIQSELMKILEIKIQDFSKYQMITDVLCQIIPEIKQIKDFEQDTPWHEYDVLNHSYKVMTEIDKPLLKLAALLHDIAKPMCKVKKSGQEHYHYYGHDVLGAEVACEIMKSLKFSNQNIEYVSNIIKLHQVTFSNNCFKIFNKLLDKNNIDISFIYDLLEFIKADNSRDSSTINEMIIKRQIMQNEIPIDDVILKLNQYKEQTNNPEIAINQNTLAINGSILIELGFKQGKELGELLRDIKNLIIDEQITNETSILIEYAKSKLKSK